MRIRRASQWISHVQEATEAALLRSDTQSRVRAVALAILERSDKDRLSRPTWAFLQARTGLSRATVARHLAWLRQQGLLATVAPGRRGIFAPGGALSGKLPGEYEVPEENHPSDPENEAALYVLCELAPLTVIEDNGGVDETETPPPLGVKNHPRTRARGDFSSQTEPLRGTDSQAASRPPGGAAWRHLTPWPAGHTPSGKDNMLRAAAELQNRVPVLRHISAQHVRSLCREFFLAGWTIIDLHQALDHRPDGSTWPHSGANGVENCGAWLRHRLASWRHDGTVLRSPSQRSTAEAAGAKARARARREAHEQHRKAHPSRQRSQAAEAALATARALASTQNRAQQLAHHLLSGLPDIATLSGSPDGPDDGSVGELDN